MSTKISLQYIFICITTTCALALILGGGLSLSVSAQSESADPSESEAEEQLLLEKIDAQIAADDFVNGMLAYMTFIDTHPASYCAVTAFMRLDEQKTLADEGAVPASSVLKLVENMPALTAMNTAFGRYVAFEGHLYKVQMLKAGGDLSAAQALCGELRTGLLESMWAFPDDPAVYHMANEAVRVSRMLDLETVAATLAELEKFVAEKGPSIGSYAARVALIERYSKEERWDERAAHFPAILDQAQADYVTAALTASSTLPAQKLAMLWTLGLAQMTNGSYQEALGTFRATCAIEGPDNTSYREWAAFSIPKTIQMMHRGDPATAIQAYEDYLQQAAVGGSGGEPEYANLARVEIGRLLVKQGEAEQALPYFETARLDTKHHEVVTMAEESLAKLAEIAEGSDDSTK